MRVQDAAVVDVRPLLPDLRGDLVGLLRAISDDDWFGPTAVPRWRVKDIALHLLDDDLGRLSRLRDDDGSGLLPHDDDPRRFVAALNAKNQRWVDGATGLSRRVVVDLLVWAGRELADHDAAADLTSPAFVGWADDVPVPAWLDLAREFTEQWVHQQQIMQAVRRAGNHRRFLDLVLRTFVWAYPFQLGRHPDLPGDAVVGLDLGAGRRWDVVRRHNVWELEEPGTATPDATVKMDGDLAWQVLTGADVDPGAVASTGDQALVEAVLAVRAVLV